MPEKSIQHYRVTLDQAKRDYKDGLLTATGLVYYAIAILRPVGQKLRIKNISSFINDLGIKRSAFYRAISKLKIQDLLDWEPTEGLDVWASPSKGIATLPCPEVPLSKHEPVTATPIGHSTIRDTESHIVDTESHIVDTESHIVDTESHIVDTESHIVEFEGSKPASSKGFKTSPDITDIYQIFLISLSNSEREIFENFSRKMVGRLPKLPVLPEKWIEVNHQQIWKQYKNAIEEDENIGEQYKGADTKREAIKMPNSEQMAKLQEFQDVGQVKRIYLQRYKNGETIVIDTGSEVLWWWEFLERDSGTGSKVDYSKEVHTMIKTLCGG